MRFGNRRFGCMKAMQIYISVTKYLVKPINGEARHYTKSRPATPSLGSLIKDVPSSTDILRSCKQHLRLQFPSNFPPQLLDEFSLSSSMFPFNLSVYLSLHLLYSLYIFSISDNSFEVVSSVVLYYVPLFSLPHSITYSVVSSWLLHSGHLPTFCH